MHDSGTARLLEFLRSRAFIERLTATRLVAKNAISADGALSDAELAEGLGLPLPIAQILFTFMEAWDLSEAALAQIAAHHVIAASEREAKH